MGHLQSCACSFFLRKKGVLLHVSWWHTELKLRERERECTLQFCARRRTLSYSRQRRLSAELQAAIAHFLGWESKEREAGRTFEIRKGFPKSSSSSHSIVLRARTNTHRVFRFQKHYSMNSKTYFSLPFQFYLNLFWRFQFLQNWTRPQITIVCFVSWKLHSSCWKINMFSSCSIVILSCTERPLFNWK